MKLINFIPEEFIPRETFEHMKEKYGNGNLGMRYIDQRVVALAELVRMKYGKPVSLNTWIAGGLIDGRVLRLPSDKDYRPYSDHTYGRAIDFEVVGVDSDQVQQDILYKWSADFLAVGLTGMEDGTHGWTHLTVANLDNWGTIINGIKLLKPSV